MGFNIGGIAKDLGINLPKIDFGNIGKTVLEEGKKLLGEVVKDTFTLSNKPGETFADDMNLNVLGESVRLPNPIGRLANKLLGNVDSKLGQFGVNIDFKTALSKLFHLPTQAGEVSVPPAKSRIISGAFGGAGAAATGGGFVAQSFAKSSASGADATGGASAPTTTDVPVAQLPGNGAASGDSAIEAAATRAGATIDNLESQITALASKDDAASKAQLIVLQSKLSRANEMMSLLSQILQQEHQTRQQMIQNIR